MAELAEWTTVITSMFLHGGVAHLIGNCWFLWVFGNNVEERLGSFLFILFYIICGTCAALIEVVTDVGSTVPMIGASGAISGVLGAYFVFYPRSWVIALVPWIVPVLPIPAVVFLLLWFLMQAYSGIGGLLGVVHGTEGVAWWAHAGGFVVGVGLARLVPRQRGR